MHRLKNMLTLIKKWVEITGVKNICISGGYGLNVVANSYYVKHLPDCKFYFDPLADDSGTSIGAALFLYYLKTQDTRIYYPKYNFYHLCFLYLTLSLSKLLLDIFIIISF